MSWLIMIVAGVLGSLAAGAGMFAIAFLWVKWFQISSFEGASGYFIVGLALLGTVVGLVLSIMVARVAHVQIGREWYIQIGAAIVAVATSLLIVLAISYLQADLTPDLGGQDIVVVWEVRLPKEIDTTFPDNADPREWNDEELRLQLVSVVGGTSPLSGEKPRLIVKHSVLRMDNGFCRLEFHCLRAKEICASILSWQVATTVSGHLSNQLSVRLTFSGAVG